MLTSLAPSPIAMQTFPRLRTKLTIIAFCFGVDLAQITESAFIKMEASRSLSFLKSSGWEKMKSHESEK
jgi:hypothetical protein